MKNIILIMATLLIILGICISTDLYVSSSYEKIEKLIAEAKATPEKQQSKALMDKWEETSKKWQVLVTHVEIDHINQFMYQYYYYMELDMPDLALAELAVAEQMLSSVPRRHKLILSNVF